MRFNHGASVADIKAECARRILARYPLGKQSTIALRGGVERDEMQAFIEAMIAASHRLEATSPIPARYRDDQFWSA